MATRRKQKGKTNPDLSRLENLEPESLNLTQELPIEEQKVLLNQDINKTENSFIPSIDIKEIIEDYRNMSIEDKEKSHLKNIDEIKYLIGYITNYNLIHGNNYSPYAKLAKQG